MLVTLCSQCATGLSERHFLQLFHEMSESSGVGVPWTLASTASSGTDEDPLEARQVMKQESSQQVTEIITSTPTQHTQVHQTTLYYTALHDTTVHCTRRHTARSYTTLHDPNLHHSTPHYTTPHCTPPPPPPPLPPPTSPPQQPHVKLRS